MKSWAILASIGLWSSSALAQSQCSSVAAAIPSCGVPCLNSAASAIGCATDAYACQCSSSSQLQASALNCVVASCGILPGLQVQSSALAVCSCVATAIVASSTTPTTTTSSTTTSSSSTALPSSSSSIATSTSSTLLTCPSASTATITETAPGSTITVTQGGAVVTKSIVKTVTVTRGGAGYTPTKYITSTITKFKDHYVTVTKTKTSTVPAHSYGPPPSEAEKVCKKYSNRRDYVACCVQQLLNPKY